MSNIGIAKAYRFLHEESLRWFDIWWTPGGVRRIRESTLRDYDGERFEPKRLLVDVSIIVVHDAGTGIQRVVRSIVENLLNSPPEGMTVQLVKATRKRPYRYANHYQAELTGQSCLQEDSIVDAGAGDIFLGLDLSSRPLPMRQRELHAWRARGARLAFVVYDLLPAMHPQWFTPAAGKFFKRWLGTLAIHADALFCISDSVAKQAREWFADKYELSERDIFIDWFHLGANFPAIGAHILDNSIEELIDAHDGLTVLMVGTVEPRKGYAQVLDAFEQLWRQGNSTRLVIAGRPGWHVEHLIARLAQCEENSRNLIWLRDATDAQLTLLYSNADGLIMASEAEGFGLPLIEAAKYDVPILARDLPVFREIAEDHATYFEADSGEILAERMRFWINDIKLEKVKRSGKMQMLTWADSAAQIKKLLSKLN